VLVHRPLLGVGIATAVSLITGPIGIALIFGAIGLYAAGTTRGRQ
jgi:hypothetical protein